MLVFGISGKEGVLVRISPSWIVEGRNILRMKGAVNCKVNSCGDLVWILRDVRRRVGGVKKGGVLVGVTTGWDGIENRSGSSYRGSAKPFCTKPLNGTSVSDGRPFMPLSLVIFAAIRMGIEGDRWIDLLTSDTLGAPIIRRARKQSCNLMWTTFLIIIVSL